MSVVEERVKPRGTASNDLMWHCNEILSFEVSHISQLINNYVQINYILQYFKALKMALVLFSTLPVLLR